MLGSKVDPMSPSPTASRGGVHASRFKPKQHLPPALGGLPYPVLFRQKALVALLIHPNNHQRAQLRILSAQAAVDPVDPEVDPAVFVQP